MEYSQMWSLLASHRNVNEKGQNGKIDINCGKQHQIHPEYWSLETCKNSPEIRLTKLEEIH